MSEGAAGRRVTAARVCRRFPEAFELVARGQLHLCALCVLAPNLNPENATELFEASKGKTRRQIEELLAARFPRPDVREQIRRLPARAQAPAATVATAATAPTAAEQTVSPAPAFDPLVSPSADAEVPAISPNPNPMPPPAGAAVAEVRRRTREFEPLSPARFGVHFTADAELRDLLERARALASHRLPNGDLAGLMKLMAASFVEQEEKRRFGIGARPRRVKTGTKTGTKMGTKTGTKKEMRTKTEMGTKTGTETGTKKEMETVARAAGRATPTGAPAEVSLSAAASEATTGERRAVPTSRRGRYVAVAVRREAHVRDRGQCAFVAADGRRCTASARLEFDHVKPFARLGASDALNIRLLCRAHNLLHARTCFGAMHVAAKIAARKRP